MTGWLVGKTARIIGEHSAIKAALTRAGAIYSDGPADMLVHVALPQSGRPAHEISFGDWRLTLDEGLDSRFRAASDFAAGCRERGRGGAIVFVGAPEQTRGSDHAAAAGALGNLTKTLVVEWARDGIRVNTILTHADDETLGNLVTYLLSDYAAYATGAVMAVSIDD
jgi:NAD(P)-dependent dehydrogenase (short-subunit alcohol dehydrogenase family)